MQHVGMSQVRTARYLRRSAMGRLHHYSKFLRRSAALKTTDLRSYLT